MAPRLRGLFLPYARVFNLFQEGNEINAAPFFTIFSQKN